ncbi:MAG: fibronectin type III domain-containing protein [Flavobacteriaceae bacterium]|nr:fibronectin type III domain-containing protein [Flavobacteriaceae bacterium]
MKRLGLIIFLLICISACSNNDDNTTIECATPTSLNATDITHNSALLSWNSTSSQDVLVNGGPSGSMPSVSENVTGSNLSVTGLQPNTTYEFSVQAICSIDNVSMLSTVLRFTTNASPVIPEFLTNLSDLNIFTGSLSNLNISSKAFKYEIITPLFTDYASKLRLIALPEDLSMAYDGDGFPMFPNGTLIAKTFFYNLDETNLSLGKKIIETRVLIRKNDAWLLGNYKWNDTQSDATLTDAEHTVPVAWVNAEGEDMSTNYIVPSNADCIKCHSNAGDIVALGPKLRNMNFEVDGENQLQKFINNGHLLNAPDPNTIAALPNWEDESLTLNQRARSYFDVNCAHCHSPGGFCDQESLLDLRYETPLENTNIVESGNSIEGRMGVYLPGWSMPFIGTTMVHDEGYDLIEAYISSLD